ncbi:hypothetical protein EMIHUDRAFT_112111 [Emiliania huxleyi CCMP1516]|uniref:16S rRNA (uracil(1498)-N(3))-methyltransferase n=2 Tax=Emiliania huxleyi TaxID=2903 RepID=A0A0D3KAH7_EMIH1|nr:hypothetical protein EMIHUDRAFT_112109 [Emiliania huxleyi CCMP1516]XP_005785191.1 hypothetical protein EMIHUDRAFT_112111 [Emiliania huxleyi CCMP1516]EOD32760.1 hypothetical protein EMIHUDRAFT_112109 [Emiliania huxleyi CCMP1516]EOD32762.1 hypothetical protein EMIHUDRAFT_112111 [Emiliania huxleyi CCMP1516]|eukprot:XP_005785189.1 hypothetical protein EMIHUDRAFT_112109 [Emiliania huxleyi CCMP1516]
MSSLAALALAGAGACARAGGGRALGPRLHVPQPLAAGCGVGLPEAQRHYLFSVMRLREGGRARLFNADDGEFEAVVDAIGKRECRVSLLSRLRPPPAPEEGGGPTLLFGVLKGARLPTLVEKATELGAGALQPVLCERCAARSLNLDRLSAIATEARAPQRRPSRAAG